MSLDFVVKEESNFHKYMTMELNYASQPIYSLVSEAQETTDAGTLSKSQSAGGTQ